MIFGGLYGIVYETISGNRYFKRVSANLDRVIEFLIKNGTKLIATQF